jgi:hypothetical protein
VPASALFVTPFSTIVTDPPAATATGALNVTSVPLRLENETTWPLKVPLVIDVTVLPSGRSTMLDEDVVRLHPEMFGTVAPSV